MKGPDDIPDGTLVYVDEGGGIHPVVTGLPLPRVAGVALRDSTPLPDGRHAVTVLTRGAISAPTELHAVSPVYLPASTPTRWQRLRAWLRVWLHKQ